MITCDCIKSRTRIKCNFRWYKSTTSSSWMLFGAGLPLRREFFYGESIDFTHKETLIPTGIELHRNIDMILRTDCRSISESIEESTSLNKLSQASALTFGDSNTSGSWIWLELQSENQCTVLLTQKLGISFLPWSDSSWRIFSRVWPSSVRSLLTAALPSAWEKWIWIVDIAWFEWVFVTKMKWCTYCKCL